MTNHIVRSLLVRGMVAGLLAGVAAFAVAYLVGEPPLRGALVYESAHTRDRGMEVVSRGMQETLGLATGTVLLGVVLGGIAALVFAFAWRRIGEFGPRGTAALVAFAAFSVTFLVPFLKYPANPPAVSNPDTLNGRTSAYFGMVLASILVSIAAMILWRSLRTRWGAWNATITATGGFVLAMVLVGIAMPNVREMPHDFPATVVWDFRVAAIAIQVALWSSFALIFGELAARLMAPASHPTH